MSGSRVTFLGDAMAAVVRGVIEVHNLIGQPPVIVGGLAVLSRLTTPYRATVDLDLVDRMASDAPQLKVLPADGTRINVTTPVAEPGPLIAMKLQAVMNRAVNKQGTDLLDIVRLTFDEATRSVALSQIGDVEAAVAADIALHVDLWFVRKRRQALTWIRAGPTRTARRGGLTATAVSGPSPAAPGAASRGR